MDFASMLNATLIGVDGEREGIDSYSDSYSIQKILENGVKEFWLEQSILIHSYSYIVYCISIFLPLFQLFIHFYYGPNYP